MTEYKKGKIYKIIYIGNENINITYIGSTFNTLRDRQQGHKDNFKKWINDKQNKSITIFPFYEKYDIKSFKIILIKEYEVCDRNHLFMYEQLWMNKLKCINEQKAFEPLFKQRNKEYREKNKDKIKAKKKEYCENNKDKIKEYREKNKEKAKEYYENNKEKINEYCEKNKDKIKERKKEYRKIKVICECGSEFINNNKSRHLKSKKHLKFQDSSL